MRAALVAGILLAAGVARADSTCSESKDTIQFVGTTVATVPTTALAKRTEITVCNSAENAGTPKIKCRSDNGTPVMGAVDGGTGYAGVVLEKKDCVTYTLKADKPVKCISDTAPTALHITECRR